MVYWSSVRLFCRRLSPCSCPTVAVKRRRDRDKETEKRDKETKRQRKETKRQTKRQRQTNKQTNKNKTKTPTITKSIISFKDSLKNLSDLNKIYFL